MTRINPLALRYALAIFAAVCALLLRSLLTPVLGTQNPYHTVWLAVAFSAWYCGLGPSIVTTILAALGVWYWFLPPFDSFAIQDKTQIFGMVGFLVFSTCIIALGESNRRASASRFRLAAIVDSSEDAIVSKTLDGIITTWNRGAQRLFGWTQQEAVGRPITIIIPEELRDEESSIIRRLAAGERIEEYETVRITKTGEKRFVSLTISPLRDWTGTIVGGSKIARDITERKQVEAKLQSARDELEERVRQRTAELSEKNAELVKQGETVRELSARLLQMQDEERRRLARELHDSAGQFIAALSMNISRVAREKERLSTDAQRCAAENLQLVEQLSQEIRTMSHLLHPPLLDEAGLGSAIRWYIDGFAERSKIAVRLDMPEAFDRLSDDQEIAIFRVVQECLTNIHRHSNSATAIIQLSREEGQVHVKVRDEGTGMPPEKQLALVSSGKLGVGLRGMRERIRQLGGALEVESTPKGTTVRATVPCAEYSSPLKVLSATER